MTSSHTKLDDVLKQVSRKVDVQAGVDYPELGLRAHGKGTFHKPAVNGSDTTKDLYSVEQGDLLLSVVFAWEGAVAVAGPADHGRFTSHRFPAFRCDSSLAIEEYMALWLAHGPGRQLLVANSPGGAGRNKTLNKTALLACTAHLPPVAEQRRVVDLLTAADSMVETLRTELDMARSMLRQLMNDTLAPGTSTAGASIKSAAYAGVRVGTWGDLVAFRKQVKSADGQLLTVATKGAGTRPAQPRPDSRTATHMVHAGELVYLRQGAASGAVAVAGQSGLVSVNFPVGTLSNSVQREYVGLLLRCDHVLHSFRIASQGTAQPFLSERDFVAIPVAYHEQPAVQQLIVDMISVAEQAVKDVDMKLQGAQALRDQLLHDLLSGNHTIPEAYDRFLKQAPL